MKRVHFFKAKSRMGLAGQKSLQRRSDVGVEDGSDAILTDDFLAKIPQSCVSEYIFPKPEEVKTEQFSEVLAKQVNGFKEFINKHLKPGQLQVVVGGDHSVTLPSILAVRDRIGGFENLGYVQFDSHGDINLRASSPTDNFHGMYVRTLVSRFDIPEISKLVPRRLPVKNIIYIGNLDLDYEEADFFDKNRIKKINRKTLLENKGDAIKNFKNFVSSFKYLHVTFDIDVLDKIQASATGIPAENGLMLEDMTELLNIIAEHPNLSLDLTEVNPQKAGLKRTVQSAHAVLSALLSI